MQDMSNAEVTIQNYNQMDIMKRYNEGWTPTIIEGAYNSAHNTLHST